MFKAFIVLTSRLKKIAYVLLVLSSQTNAMQEKISDSLEKTQRGVRESFLQSREDGEESVNIFSHGTTDSPTIMKEESKNWRKSWFVKNIIVGIPIVGDFFHDSNVKETLKRAGKSTFMMMGGSIGMMLDFTNTSESDNIAVKTTKAAVNMTIGIGAANIIYNVSSEGFYFVYSKVKKFFKSTENNQDIKTPLILERD
ncbi:MAG TPA: hypothetical protein PLY23_06895 [Alphaproteobacteria bacterium]|nr:MAG: hypothetical protein B7X84_08035 [Alphaproteobacteria bacterium 17-39-52]HQS84611.1 hypothetical protein [Alphaproteobacteria bacterium]HQS93662.1 hypothetical protein [Alphaproteobacteria bacterium]